jgi:hypothetical protein
MLFSNGKGRNIFHYQMDDVVARSIWGKTMHQRDTDWAHECVATFKNIPDMPRPVSANEMAKKWGVCHITAKRMLMHDWEWQAITSKWWVHDSFMDPFTKLHEKCMISSNPISCFLALNAIKKHVEDIKYPRKDIITRWIGDSGFNILKKAGILKPVRRLKSATKYYFIG